MTPVPHAPRFEHHADGRIGIGEARPRLSWRVEDADPSYRQSRVRIRLERQLPGHPVAITTHEIETADQVLVAWPDEAPLQSREAVRAQVQLCDATGSWGEWGPPGSVEVGLLDPADWVASLVGPADAGSHEPPLRTPGRLRSEFDAPAEILQARLYLTAHGLVEAEINGTRIGDEELTPGWTSYRHRLRYASFDVTAQITAGPNAIGLWLGDGWWRGHLGFGGGTTDVYGDEIGALAQLEIVGQDGSITTVVTDDTWQAGPGPIVTSGLYAGEHFDARLHDPRWSTAGWTFPSTLPITVGVVERERFVAPTGPPVRCVEVLRPVSVEAKGGGRWLLDFGQNHSGRLRIDARGPEGSVIRLRHAEVLVDGEIATEPLRNADATDVLLLDGGSVRWEPRFTIHGYRFAEISGWTGDLTADDVVSRVIHTDLERRGWFGSSDPVIDRLHENVVWSLRSNFVDIPTDCPQRDERLGWTGDLQVFAPTAAFIYDVSGMLSSWLQDVAAEQEEFDWVPPWIPYFPLEPFSSLPRDPFAVWSDVTVLTPDVLHERTGDVGVLRAQYDSAVAFLGHVERAAGADRICRGSEQLGDWLDPSAPPENPFEATTDKYLVATAYFAHSARRLASIARVLGEQQDAERYRQLGDEVAAAYAARFLLPGGRATSDTQTAYSLTTVFELWPDEESRLAGTTRLAELVRESGGRIATGFAGTPVVADALTLGDRMAEAYQLLECTDCPSWLYTVLAGGTTTWERWDSLRPDGTLNASSMTSFNHYALGSVADWLHRVVAGLAPAEPGYRRIRFEPRPGGSLTHASAEHDTPYGRAAISWTVDEKGLLETVVTVPVGATAEVVLPGRAAETVGHGSFRYSTALAPGATP